MKNYSTKILYYCVLRIDYDITTSRRSEENSLWSLHPSTKAQDQVQGRFFLDVVVRERATVF